MQHMGVKNLLCDMQLHNYIYLLQNKLTERRRDRPGKPEIKNKKSHSEKPVSHTMSKSHKRTPS